MSKVVAVYTGQGLSDQLKPIFQELLPDSQVINVIDDGIIHDIQQDGINEAIIRRLFTYYRQAEEMGADVILNTCSSIGEVVDQVQPLIKTPIVKIDEMMAQEAINNYKRVGVMATLPTTLEPTIRLVKAQAVQAGKQVEVVNGLAEGAFHALIGGNPEEHDLKIEQTAEKIADQVDVIVLAQGSMARMQQKLQEKTGKPVLSSPRLGITAVKNIIEQNNR